MATPSLKLMVALALVVITIASAQVPRKRIEVIRKPAPYVSSGWTPSGPQLNLPLRVPASTSTTTPLPTTTTEEAIVEEISTQNSDPRKFENVEFKPEEEEKESRKVPKLQQFYVVVPRAENLVYSVPRRSALFEVPSGNVVDFLKAAPFNTAPTFTTPFIQIY